MTSLLLASYALGQSSNNSKFNLKNGLYLSLVEVKNNTPAYPMNKYVRASFLKKFSSIEANTFQTDENSDNKIIAGDVFAVVMDGELFLHYYQENVFDSKESRQYYFYKVYSLGTISLYFVERLSRELSPGPVPTVASQTPRETTRTIKEIEYAINLRDGKKYNLKTDKKELIEFLKTDANFDPKIKKSDIYLHIMKYNKLYPLDFKKQSSGRKSD